MLFPYRYVHFVGIGGVGMSGLALILKEIGCTITGSDESESEFIEILRKLGVYVCIGHHKDHIPDHCDLVVYSSAVSPDNVERREAKNRKIPTIARGHLLSLLSHHYYTQTIAVAGSHGKTTTTAMSAWIAYQADLHPGYLIGGMPKNFSLHASRGKPTLFITEVDESDGSQNFLYPTFTIITNVDDDHSWSLNGQEGLRNSFHQLILQSQRVFIFNEERTRRELQDYQYPHITWVSWPEVPYSLQIPGSHNQINAEMAASAMKALGISDDHIRNALSSFLGVKRRMSILYESPRYILIEDYAHHPRELEVTLASIREKWPSYSLRVIFQPHRYERIVHYAADFGRILSQVSSVWIYRPFAAWVHDEYKADPKAILKFITHPNKQYIDKVSSEFYNDFLKEDSQPTILVIIGAGDIHQLAKLILNRLQEYKL